MEKKVTRRDILKTGVFVVVGGKLGMEPNCLPSRVLPLPLEVNVIQVDLVLGFDGENRIDWKKPGKVYTLVVTAYSGVPESERIDLSNPSVESWEGKVVVSKEVCTWLLRKEALDALIRHASSIVCKGEDDWDEIADQLVQAVFDAECLQMGL